MCHHPPPGPGPWSDDRSSSPRQAALMCPWARRCPRAANTAAHLTLRTDGETEAQAVSPPQATWPGMPEAKPLSPFSHPFPSSGPDLTGAQDRCEGAGRGRWRSFPGRPERPPCCPGGPAPAAGQGPTCLLRPQEAYSVARQFNLIPPICEQAEYHMFQREKVEVQLPELFHKIGGRPALPPLPQSPPPAPPPPVPALPRPPPVPAPCTALPQSPPPAQPSPQSHPCTALTPAALTPPGGPGHDLAWLSSCRSGCHDLVPSGLRHRFWKV